MIFGGLTMTIEGRYLLPGSYPSVHPVPQFIFHPRRLPQELAGVATAQADYRQAVLGLDLQLDYGFAYVRSGPGRPLDPRGDSALLGQVLLTELGFYHEPW